MIEAPKRLVNNLLFERIFYDYRQFSNRIFDSRFDCIVDGNNTTYKLKKADKDVENEKFSEAYQIYNSLIVQYSRKYKLPTMDNLPLTLKDLSDKGKGIAKSYVDFWISRPSPKSCYTALNGVIEISEQITIVEVYSKIISEQRLGIEEYKEVWKKSTYPDQKDLPLFEATKLETMYKSNVCFVELLGDGNTFFDGVFFNPKENICFSIEKKPGSRFSQLYSLKTGTWISVIRINRRLCASINDVFLMQEGYRANGIASHLN